MTGDVTAEDERLADDARRVRNWKRWGPYLAGRQWALAGLGRQDHLDFRCGRLRGDGGLLQLRAQVGAALHKAARALT